MLLDQLWLWVTGFTAVCALFEVASAIARPGSVPFDRRMTISNTTIKLVCALSVIVRIPGIFAYDFVFRHTTALHLPYAFTSVRAQLACLVLADFVYYVMHMLSHRCNVLWGAHVVHHQSTDFNLTVFGRNGVMESFFHAIYLVPFAVLGFPFHVIGLALIVAIFAANWQHCASIGDLGPLQWVFVTPKHHRVHHYKVENGATTTRNFGGVLILWDRLFGTFSEPAVRAEFGVSDPGPILNPIRAQTYFYRRLFERCRALSFVDGAKLLLGSASPFRPGEPAQEEETGAELPWALLIAGLILMCAIRAIAEVEVPAFYHYGVSGVSLAAGLGALAVLIGLALRICVPRGGRADRAAFVALCLLGIGFAGYLSGSATAGRQHAMLVRAGEIGYIVLVLLAPLAAPRISRPLWASPISGRSE